MKPPDATTLLVASQRDLPAYGARAHGDRVLADDGRRSITYAELHRRSDLFSQLLLANGVHPGERVALWMTNRVEWLVAQFGVYKSGACLVPVNPQFKAQELAHVLADADAVALIFEEKFLDKYDAREILDQVLRSRGNELPLRLIIRLGTDTEEHVSLDRLAPSAAPPAPDVPAAAEQIMYTSGTTGAPKGALLSGFGLLTTYSAVRDRIELESDALWVLSLPLSTMFGCAAMLIPTMLSGAGILLRPRFDAAEVLELIDSSPVTHFPGSPAMFQSLLADPASGKVDTTDLVGGMIAGSVAPPELLRSLIVDFAMPKLVNMFGQTEGCGTATMTRPGDPMEKRLSTVGVPLSHVELRIAKFRSAAGEGSGDQGEILGRGRDRGVHNFLGYHKLPQRTAEVIDGDGWLHYGDIGAIDSEGYLSVGAGRLKEMYVCGGYNVYPPEVDRLLSAHPAIAEAAVCGVPDQRLGEVGVAYVRLRADADLTAEALREWCHQEMSHYKCPQEFVFVDEFPVTSSGKVKRLALRDRWVSTQ